MELDELSAASMKNECGASVAKTPDGCSGLSVRPEEREQGGVGGGEWGERAHLFKPPTVTNYSTSEKLKHQPCKKQTLHLTFSFASSYF